MIVYIGADHRGYELKEEIEKFLYELDYQFEDMGAFEFNKDDDYPDFARAVGEMVSKHADARGIVICGSGIGVAIATNKIHGVRAGTAHNPDQVRSSVNDEDLNVLALPADWVSEEVAKEIVQVFLETQFSGEDRHVRRLNKIKELEK